ncbi:MULTISPECIES: hypothetical protein [unclassified Cedecea]|uniref:hypothetical protein n=1 Tax=unclassified Cedecea TaxID=2649846 RepID=UPI0030177EAF
MAEFLILLVLLTVALRFRFRDNHYLFIKLRRPFPAELALLILSSALCLTAQEFLCLFKEDDYLFYSMTFISVMAIWFFSYISSSSMLKTTVPDMLLTPFLSNLRVDINPRYIEALPSTKAPEYIANKIAGDISYLMSILPCKTIVFGSHLLRAGLRDSLSNSLREREISFTVTERKTHLPEAMVLNLRYGGKTRYRLFTYLKHSNGFKVHHNGGAFKIYNHKNP